jgi:hypothetical protein
MHGADKDILWLQRDFGLYVCNCFDTGQAARDLHYPSYSLAFLLERFVGIKADKSHQLADWRTRPLPVEMKRYAQQDTTYLLEIYDRLRCELLDMDVRLRRGQKKSQQSRVLAVLHRSSELCVRAYVKERFDQDRQTMAVQRTAMRFSVPVRDPSKQAVMGALVAWRDHVARIRDESVGYVLPDLVLLALSHACPTDEDSLTECLARPFVGLNVVVSGALPVPPAVSWLIGNVLSLIRKTLERAKTAPIQLAACPTVDTSEPRTPTRRRSPSSVGLPGVAAAAAALNTPVRKDSVSTPRASPMLLPRAYNVPQFALEPVLSPTVAVVES